MKFKKGHTPWNKGKKALEYMSKENFKKIVSNLIPRTREEMLYVSTFYDYSKHKNRHFSVETEFKKGYIPWNLGKSNPFFIKYNKTHKRFGKDHHYFGKKVSEKERQRLKAIGIKALLQQQNSKEPTSIEKKVYEELKNRGLLFEKQYLVNGKFLVDAYIPSLNLVIEADGEYWHSLPKVVKKDKAENAYLTKCGFNLLRLTETEINNGNFKERLVN